MSFELLKSFAFTFHDVDDGKIAVMSEVWKFSLRQGMAGRVSPGRRLSFPVLWYGGCLPTFFPVEQQFRSVLGFVNFSYQISCFPPGVETCVRRVGMAASPPWRGVAWRDILRLCEISIEFFFSPVLQVTTLIQYLEL
jgi:hypothetical protein